MFRGAIAQKKFARGRNAHSCVSNVRIHARALKNNLSQISCVARATRAFRSRSRKVFFWIIQKLRYDSNLWI